MTPNRSTTKLSLLPQHIKAVIATINHKYIFINYAGGSYGLWSTNNKSSASKFQRQHPDYRLVDLQS